MPRTPWRSAARCILIAVAVLLAPAFAGQAHAAATPGVQAHLLWSGVTADEVTRQMDAARTAGARMLRVDVGWASLEEQGKGQWNAYHLGRLDNVVSQAEARGIELLLTFWRTPCWASSAPADIKQDCTGSWWSRGIELYTPTDPRDYADALAFVARRYGTRVAGWEIWNEPNATSYYKAADPVRDYVGLLRAAYPAAKAAAPSVPVVGGSLMHADFEWTRRAYAAGARGAFDAWSIHPYSDDRSPLAGQSAEWRKLSFAEGVPAVRQVLLDHGDDKPLWLTEFGWSTSTIRDQEPWRNGVSRETQARYVGEALAHVATWPWVRAIIAFNVKDTGTDPGSRIHNFGLHDAALLPKPAVATFRAGALALAAAGDAQATAPAPTAPTPTTVSTTTAAPAPTAPTTTTTTTTATTPKTRKTRTTRSARSASATRRSTRTSTRRRARSCRVPSRRARMSRTARTRALRAARACKRARARAARAKRARAARAKRARAASAKRRAVARRRAVVRRRAVAQRRTLAQRQAAARTAAARTTAARTPVAAGTTTRR